MLSSPLHCFSFFTVKVESYFLKAAARPNAEAYRRLLRLTGTLLKLLNTTVINWRQSTPQQSKPWDHCTVHTVTRTVCHSLTFSILDHLIKTMNYFNLAEILLHPNLSLYPRLADVFLSDWYNKQFLDPCRGKRNVYLCTKPFSSEDVVVRLDICARGSKNLL